jgi:hypothetical protein
LPAAGEPARTQPTKTDPTIKPSVQHEEGYAQDTRALPDEVPETPPTLESGLHPASGALVDLEGLWVRLLEEVGRASPFTRSYLLEAHPVSWDGRTFTVGFDPEFAEHLELVDNARNRTLLQSKLKELGGGDAQIRFVQADAPTGPQPTAHSEPSVSTAASAPPAKVASVKPRSNKPARTAGAPARPTDPEEFKNDPLIRKALDVFKGQIVEVHNP